MNFFQFVIDISTCYIGATLFIAVFFGTMHWIYQLVFIKLFTLLSLISSVLITSHSYARDDVNTSQIVPTNEWQLGFTIGYGQLQQPVAKQDDIELFFIPDVRFYGENFSVENLNISYALVEKSNFVFELVGKQNLDGIYFPGDHRDAFAAVAASGTFNRQPLFEKNISDNIIAAEKILPRHKSMSYLAGGEMRIYGKFDYFLNALFDVSNVHNGYELNFNIHFQHQFLGLNSDLEVGITHKNDEMSDYYYGVDYAQFEQNNVTLSSTNNLYLQYTSAYPLSERWFALGVVKQQWLDSQIQNSPIINRSNILSYFIGIKYMY